MHLSMELAHRQQQLYNLLEFADAFVLRKYVTRKPSAEEAENMVKMPSGCGSSRESS